MASERTSRPEITIREMELDDLAPVYHLGERLFTCDLYPFLYRTWDEWEVVGHYNTDPEFSLVAEVDDSLAGFIIGRMILTTRRHGPAPSTSAALSRSSGTRASPASSSSAMNGVVFHTSASTTTASADS